MFSQNNEHRNFLSSRSKSYFNIQKTLPVKKNNIVNIIINNNKISSKE